MTMLEFLLSYTVVAGSIVAAVGVALCFLAKPLTQAKRETKDIAKDDKFYVKIMVIGISLILVGMIVIALPIRNTFYKG